MIIIPDDNILRSEVINSRSVEITSHKVMTPYTNGDGEIFALEVGEYFIQIGDEFNTKGKYIKSYYNINYIEKLTKNRFLLLTHIRNKCTSYILPCLSGTKNTFYIDSYLINPYLFENLTHLYLLYRFNTHSTYKEMESKLIEHKDYIGMEDLTNSYVIFKFKIPEEYHLDCELFIEGKYSKFSDKLKKRIQTFNKFSKKHQIVQTIFKDQELKARLERMLNVSIPLNLDLASKPDKENEIWNNKIIR